MITLKKEEIYNYKNELSQECYTNNIYIPVKCTRYNFLYNTLPRKGPQQEPQQHG